MSTRPSKSSLHSLECVRNNQQPNLDKSVRQYIFDNYTKTNRTEHLENEIKLLKSSFNGKINQQSQVINQQSKLINQLQIELNTMKTQQQKSEIFNATKKCVNSKVPPHIPGGPISFGGCITMPNMEDIHFNEFCNPSVHIQQPKKRKRRRANPMRNVINNSNNTVRLPLPKSKRIKTLNSMNSTTQTDHNNIICKTESICIFDHVLNWEFKGKELKRFMKAQTGQQIVSKTFSIKNIVFECSICPNGWELSEKGYIQFYIVVKSMPLTVSEIVIHFELSFVNKLFNETLIICNNKLPYEKGWYTETMRLSDYKDKTELKFQCNVDLLRIKYKINPWTLITPKMWSKQNIIMDKNIEYNWSINDELLIQLENKKYISYFSPYFGNTNWIAYCTSDGLEDSINGFYIGVVNCKLPSEAKYILCDVGLEGIGRKENKFSYNVDNRACIFECEFDKPLKDIKNVTFKITINVKRTFFCRNI